MNCWTKANFSYSSSSTFTSSGCEAKTRVYNFVMMYFSSPSPALSNSSSDRPAQRGWARKAVSILVRNSCTAALSLSGSGGLFEKDTMKVLMDLTNSEADGCRIRSKKSCHVSGAVEALNGSALSIVLIRSSSICAT
ncbi:hypothetical protein Hanom_Chr14g01322421 [Helianthus anomalus]